MLGDGNADCTDGSGEKKYHGIRCCPFTKGNPSTTLTIKNFNHVSPGERNQDMLVSGTDKDELLSSKVTTFLYIWYMQIVQMDQGNKSSMA